MSGAGRPGGRARLLQGRRPVWGQPRPCAAPHVLIPLARVCPSAHPCRAGLAGGQELAPNLMLLFMPVPHTSLFPWLTGLSRNQLIRYHRCVRRRTVSS